MILVISQKRTLSPCLFNYYARELILTIMCTNVGCKVGGVCTNIFAYADDIVLLAPQYLIDVLADCANSIDMLCNTYKTVCMIFSPKDKRKLVTSTFPSFQLDGRDLNYVTEFKYVGHLITNDSLRYST